eukprot:IDg1407t1
MIQLIAETLAADCSAEEHDCLLLNAQRLKIRRHEAIDKYLKRHRELRNEMRRAQYPNIAKESTTVLFAIRGLQARPSLAAQVPMLLLHRLNSLKALEAALDLLGTLERPRQTTPRPTPQDWNVPTGPPLVGRTGDGWQQHARGRGAFRGRARPYRGRDRHRVQFGRSGAHQNPAEANAAVATMDEDEWPQTVDAHVKRSSRQLK